MKKSKWLALLLAVSGVAVILDSLLGADANFALCLIGTAMIAVAILGSVCNALSLKLLLAERRGREAGLEANEN